MRQSNTGGHRLPVTRVCASRFLGQIPLQRRKRCRSCKSRLLWMLRMLRQRSTLLTITANSLVHAAPLFGLMTHLKQSLSPCCATTNHTTSAQKPRCLRSVTLFFYHEHSPNHRNKIKIRE
ncbi:hypothetical protein TraAM80_09492, partial [Trypanosoma rangeli]